MELNVVLSDAASVETKALDGEAQLVSSVVRLVAKAMTQTRIPLDFVASQTA